jgi:hypoxanthine-guanine phosphoribosyltransferase
VAGKLKTKIFVLTVSAVVCAAGLSGFLFPRPGEGTRGKAVFSMPAKISNPRHEMIGMRYDCNYKGDRLFSVNADRFSVRKKKVGLFRFGLMSEAFLQNGVIDIYSSSWRQEEIGGKNPEIVLDGKTLSANDLLFQEMISVIHAKRLTSMEIMPVSIAFHDGLQGEARISAKAASVRLKDRGVLFVGDVRLETGSKMLKTSRLLLDPASEEITVRNGFVIIANNQERSGTELVSDIFLKSF